MLRPHPQKRIRPQEIQLRPPTTLWISTVHDPTLQLVRKNERTASQRVHVLAAAKKDTGIRIAPQTHTVKYIKLPHPMRMNELPLSGRHTPRPWQARRRQIRSVLHPFVLPHHVSCLQMNRKTNRPEVKSLLRTQEGRTYDAPMLSEHRQGL